MRETWGPRARRGFTVLTVRWRIAPGRVSWCAGRVLDPARGPRGIRLVSGRKAQESVIENSVNLQVAGKPPVSTSSTP